MTARLLTPDELASFGRGDTDARRRSVRAAVGDGDRVYDRTRPYNEVTPTRLRRHETPYPDAESCFACGAPPSGGLTCPACGEETCHEMTAADFAGDMDRVLSAENLDSVFRAMIERLHDHFA